MYIPYIVSYTVFTMHKMFLKPPTKSKTVTEVIDVSAMI